MNELPDYTMPTVFSFLDIKSTRRCACVSKQWEQHAKKNIIEIRKQAACKRTQMTAQENEKIDQDFLYAAERGEVEDVLVVLGNGADVDARRKEEGDSEGATALMLAAKIGHSKTVRVLLDSGSNVNGVDAVDWTPLMWVTYGACIIPRGEGRPNDLPRFDPTDSDNSFADLYADIPDYIQIVKMLLDNGANVDATDISGWTALMFAAGYGLIIIMEELINRGADLDLSNNEGNAALRFAEACGEEEAANILREAGDVKASSSKILK